MLGERVCIFVDQATTAKQLRLVLDKVAIERVCVFLVGAPRTDLGPLLDGCEGVHYLDREGVSEKTANLGVIESWRAGRASRSFWFTGAQRCGGWLTCGYSERFSFRFFTEPSTNVFRFGPLSFALTRLPCSHWLRRRCLMNV
jgi:hypothetical protein